MEGRSKLPCLEEDALKVNLRGGGRKNTASFHRHLKGKCSEEPPAFSKKVALGMQISSKNAASPTQPSLSQ